MTPHPSSRRSWVAAVGLLLLAASWWSARLLSAPSAEIMSAEIVAYGRGLLALAGASLLLCALLAALPAARSGPPDRLRRHRAWPWLTALAVVVYIAAYATLSVQRHARFNTALYDLGIQDQVVWNTAQGDWYASSIEVGNYMGDHLQPLMALLALLYWIWPSVYWLLGFQTVVLALGAIPVYRLAARRLGGGLYGALFACAYLLYPPLGFLNRFDFHWEATAVVCLVAALESAERRRWGWTSLWLLLALLGKEEVGLTVAAFGLWLAWQGARRFGLAWAAVGVAYSLIALFWVIPAIRQAPSDTLTRYGWLGAAPGEMIITLLTQPQVVLPHLISLDMVRYLVSLVGPLGFLPLGASLTLVSLPAILYNQLSGDLPQRTIYFQYSAPIIPFMLGGAILAADRLLTWARARQSLWAGWGLALILPLWVVWNIAAINNPFTAREIGVRSWQRQPNEAAIYAALAIIPQEAAASTTMYYGAHLSQRQNLLPLVEPEDIDDLPHTEFVLLNTIDYRWQHQQTCADYAAILRHAYSTGFGLIFDQGRVVVLRRGGGDPDALRAVADRLCADEPPPKDETP